MTEIRKTKLIDRIKDKINEIIKNINNKKINKNENILK